MTVGTACITTCPTLFPQRQPQRPTKIGFQIPEATYLAWINIENLGPDHGEIENRFIENGLIIEGGDQFVENGEGFIRLNAAVPRSIIDTLLNKINHIFN